MSNVLWQSLLSPQSRLIVTSSSDDVSSDGILNSDAITVEVSVDDVRVGDSILVLPGETIPVDVRTRTIILFFVFSSMLQRSHAIILSKFDEPLYGWLLISLW
jgi:hypothetical protein